MSHRQEAWDCSRDTMNNVSLLNPMLIALSVYICIGQLNNECMKSKVASTPKHLVVETGRKLLHTVTSIS